MTPLIILDPFCIILNHFGSILYHLEPSGVPYATKQFLVWNFFAISYGKMALVNTTVFETEIVGIC